jgi:hypothetical protein
MLLLPLPLLTTSLFTHCLLTTAAATLGDFGSLSFGSMQIR